MLVVILAILNIPKPKGGENDRYCAGGNIKRNSTLDILLHMTSFSTELLIVALNYINQRQTKKASTDQRLIPIGVF